MSDKEVKKVKPDIDPTSQLSEDNLENVSGGLWDITLIDTCQHKYDYDHCCNNFGNCPQLVVFSDNIEVSNGRRIRHITCACNKGYFNGVSDSHRA